MWELFVSSVHTCCHRFLLVELLLLWRREARVRVHDGLELSFRLNRALCGARQQTQSEAKRQSLCVPTRGARRSRAEQPEPHATWKLRVLSERCATENRAWGP